MLMPVHVEALFLPAANYLTQEPVATEENEITLPNGVKKVIKKPINGWAPIRSKDNIYSYGAVTGESKCKMSNASGMPMHVIIETENRMITYLQCPDKVRKGRIPLSQ